MIGKTKAPPVCVDATLMQDAMSTEELSNLTFPAVWVSTPQTPPSLPTSAPPGSPPPGSSVVSSGSSTASRESSLSDLEGSNGTLHGNNPHSSSHRSRKEDSERINLKVTTQTISRNGRQTQRWFTDPTSQRLYRMTTGCVPIVEGGKVLFVSSSRKPEWILPKGGWENDEGLEESAIRETFEEAGVLGILGPLLSEIEYETRKAKKRRLEYEEIRGKSKQIRDAHSASPNAEHGTPRDDLGAAPTCPNAQAPPTELASPAAPVANEVLSRIRGHSAKLHNSDGETCSVASEASQGHTHVKMALFPLYVTEVRDKWPEQGRLRKAVDIDEAIRITESRPEFQAALKELKERNLHFPVKDLYQPRGTPTAPPASERPVEVEGAR